MPEGKRPLSTSNTPVLKNPSLLRDEGKACLCLTRVYNRLSSGEQVVFKATLKAAMSLWTNLFLLNVAFCVPLPRPPNLEDEVKVLEWLSSVPEATLAFLSFDTLFAFKASVLCIAPQLVPNEWRILSSHFRQTVVKSRSC